MVINWQYNKISIQFENSDSDSEQCIMKDGIDLLKTIILLSKEKRV